MPARTVRRAGSSNTRTKARESTPGEIPDEGPATSLRQQVCAVFGDVQLSNTGHRKLVVKLRKIQEACCYEPADSRNSSSQEDFDENDFHQEITRCLSRILPVKKSEPVGDRVVRFLGLFLKHATEQDNAIFQEQDPDTTVGALETPTSRLTSQIISLVIPLLQSKDKVVRFRCTQIISHLINTLDAIDDELFGVIRLALLKRLRDKESSVRVQAVCGLGRLAGEMDGMQEDEDSDDDAAGGVLEKLLQVLQNDPSAEVRRSLLLNLPFTPSTLPFLLERARDLDGTIRRALYARLLPALGDFRHLSLTHREKLLRWGMRDRDENVQKATARLFRERWIEDCARPRDEQGQPVELKPGEVVEPSLDALLELLERIDVINAGTEGGIALEAMKAFWEGRPDYREHVTFDETFWTNLTPESVFVARTFNDFCHGEDASDAMQEKLPEVTRLAFLLQSNINTLVELVQRIAVQEDAEEDSIQQEFVVEQLLHIALTLDYSDEVGRRTMFSLMREALALAELPEEATKLVVEVLRMSCGTNAAAERDFCGVVLEAIAEVHDTIIGEEPPKEEDPDESFHSARSELSRDGTPKQAEDEEVDEEKAIREIMVNMKCLHIAQCMLQNVDCTLEQSAHLVTMLNNLVVPAVRSQEAPIRERGLLCLGLCCLLDKNLAEENLTLFLHCFTKGHEQLQTIAIQIIGDILTAHPSMLMQTASASEEGAEASETQEHALQRPVHKLFSKALKSPSHGVQSTACSALSKLMLSAPSRGQRGGSTSILDTDELLRLLVTAYFDPDTAANSALRQALSYFIPVYCFSRKDNMQCMGSIALEVLRWYNSTKEELDVDAEDESYSEMVGTSVVIAHLVDWTDARKLATARKISAFGDETQTEDCDVHLELAERLFEKMLGSCPKEERKLYISMIGKLYFSGNADATKLKTVSVLADEAVDDKIATDGPTRNMLLKVQAALSKAVSAKDAGSNRSRAQSIAPSAFEDEDTRTVAGDEDDATEAVREAVSELVIHSAMTTPATSPRKRAPSATSGGRRQTGSKFATDEDGDVSEATMSVTTTPAASPRKNAGRRKTAPAPIAAIDEEDGDTVMEDAPPPMPSPRKSARARRTTSTLPSAAQESLDFEQENMPPPPEDHNGGASPTKKARGRPKRATASTLPSEPLMDSAETSGASDPVVKVEEDGDEAVLEAPVKKPRGRPPKAAGTAAPRKSVRAGRRKASEMED